MRMRPRPMAIVKLRAAFGVGFIAFGLVIGVKLLFFQTAPLANRWMGLAFCVVLVAFGGVRIREYLLARRGEAGA